VLKTAVASNLKQTFGRYELLERLGEGGMAEVFKAKSFGVEGFEKVLVIKRILPKLAEHPRFVDMFVHEAKLAVRLSHANIVQVFDLGRVDHGDEKATSYFIAMEYVPGLDLASVLSACRRGKLELPFGLAVFLTAEVSKALDHAHRRRDERSRPLGIVHRDISPQNILLSWEGEVKVTDFGIAKAKDSIGDEEEEGERRGGHVRGKLAYMSPEQARAEPIDGRSDLFSLGTVLYEMLAGNNPFVAPTAFETLRRVQAGEFPPLEILRPETPRPLVEIVHKMLARSPDARFADAGKLHEHLLGYFYASGERFGPSRLAEFLEPFHLDRSSHDIEPGKALVDEQGQANERTPVEIPNPAATAVTRPPPASAPFKLTAERVEFTRTNDIGERREVTALVLSFLGAPRKGAGDDGSLVLVPPRAREVLARYGARIFEEEASQLVALFGLGDADGRDTEAAVRAALVILRARTGGVVVSAGVHAARVVIDAQGDPIRDERLASLIATAQALARATEGRVVASRLVARIIRAEFTTEELPSAGSAVPEGGRIVSSARSPEAIYGRFVGRHDELKRLGDILAAATRRRSQLVCVEGEQGIGKTRLIAEVERRLGKGNYNVGFYVASCPKNGADVPWSGLVSMLRVLCGIEEGDDEARILDVLPRLRALGLQPDECAAVLSQIGASPDGAGKQPQDANAALRAAFTRMVQRLCDDRLHCLCWDDAHAMDQVTLEAIASVTVRGRVDGETSAPHGPHKPGDTLPPVSSSLTGGVRAVFMLATRGAPPEALARSVSLHRLSLGELSDDDGARLISTRLGARVLSPDLLGFCRERAGGHPLFLEELLKELADSGAVTVQNGEAQSRLEGATAIPRTLRTLIAGRVSRLDPTERAVLQASAILGEPILTPVLAALLKQSVSQVDRAVSNLALRDLLRATSAAQVRFASPIYGEIVLDAIPPEARRELHAASAEAFLSATEEATGHEERIGNHLYEAGDRDRAAGYFAMAALHKIRVGQLDPSIRLLCRALDLADHDRRAADELAIWLGALADVLSRVRHAPDLERVATRALRRIDAAGERTAQVTARVDVARALSSVNLFEAAARILDEAFALAGDDARLHREALVVTIESTSRSGDFTRSLRAVEELEALGPLRSARVLLAVSYVRAASGNREAALRAIDEAEALSQPDDLVAAVERERQRVLAYLNTRDFRAAVDASERAVELARATSVRFAIAAALHNLGDAARRLGDLPRAYAALTESREICDAAGQDRLATLNRIHLAYLDGASGVAGAEAILSSLVEYVDARGFVTDGLEGHLLLGVLRKKHGDAAGARRELEHVLTRAQAFGDRSLVEDAREALDEPPIDDPTRDINDTVT
jgi:eukaryotic-like serine/threonine-protein kinase